MFKKLTLSIMAVAAVSALVAGSTFALFSATTTNASNTFTAGTVSLGAPMNTIVNVTNVAPGDSGSGTYSIQYTGSLEAWVGVDFTAGGSLTTCDPGKFTATLNGLSPSASTQVLGKKNQGNTVNLALNWNLDRAAGNTCQAATAQLGITVKAVQTAHNANTTDTAPVDWN